MTLKKMDNDTREIGLSEEAIVKSDKDIATITALDELAKSTGNILVLTGGYAVEALCGGKIARAHGDVDAHFILTGSKSSDEIFSGVRDLLNKEGTKWKLKDQQSDKVDYLEDDENKEFFERRRIEVRLNAPHEANIKYPKRKLIDSQGNTINVCVNDLSEMVSGKMFKFFEMKDGVDTSKDRHSSLSDYVDLRRLLGAEGFNKELVLKQLESFLNLTDSNTSKNKALEIYDYATTLVFNKPLPNVG